MERIDIDYPLSEKAIVVYKISDLGEAVKLVALNNGLINDQLSKRFKSKVYSFQDGKLLEERTFGVRKDISLYDNLNDLLFCRRVFITVRQDTKSRMYDIRCDGNEVTSILAKIGGELDPDVYDETRKLYRLKNGKILVVYRNGEGVIYNTMSDLQYIDPFDSTEVDYEDILIERKTRLFVSDNVWVTIQVVTNQTALSLIKNQVMDKDGLIRLKTGEVLKQFNENLWGVFKDYTDYKLAELVRHNMKDSNSLVYNGKFDGLIRDTNEFKKVISDCRPQLAKYLALNESQLDNSVTSLSLVDSEINKYYCDRFFVFTIAPYVSAYAGEVIKTRIQGSWQFKNISKEGYFIAQIANEKGLYVDFISLIFTEFENQKSTGDFASSSIVEGLLLGKTITKSR